MLSRENRARASGGSGARQERTRCMSPPIQITAPAWWKTVASMSGPRPSSRLTACASQAELASTRSAMAAAAIQLTRAAGRPRRRAATTAKARTRTMPTRLARPNSVTTKSITGQRPSASASTQGCSTNSTTAREQASNSAPSAMRLPTRPSVSGAAAERADPARSTTRA